MTLWNRTIVIEKEKCTINLNKTTYIGANILELSKILVSDFHHNSIKNEYGNKAELLLTDVDSLMYKIVYKEFYKDKELFDFNNYLRESKNQNIMIRQLT